MAKSLRTLQVYNSMKSLVEGTLDEVLVRVAQNLGESLPNESLKRGVRRDLNELVESHVVEILYFTPSGDPILPEEEEGYRNKRTRYRLVEASRQQFKGQAVLDRYSIDGFAKDLLLPSLNFTDNYTLIPQGALVVAFDGVGGTFVYLWVAKEDLPVSIEFGRKVKQGTVDLLNTESLKGRSLLILVENPSVSRFNLENFRGPLRVEIDASGNCHWMTSEQGGGINHAPVEDWSQVLKLFPTGEDTLEFPKLNLNWSPVVLDVKTAMDAIVGLGDMMIIPHWKN